MTLYLIVLNYDLAGDGHISIYTVSQKRDLYNSSRNLQQTDCLEKFRKSVNICQSYGQKYRGPFLTHSVLCICTTFCMCRLRIRYACHICDVFVARHLDIFRTVHVNNIVKKKRYHNIDKGV